MKKNKLLNEVYRIKEIMGISLISEGIPGATSDLIRSFFGNTVEAARGKASKIIGDLGTVIPNNLADEILDAFPRVLDNIEEYDNLSEPIKKGFMRIFREIPELSSEIYNNILKQIDTTADELSGAIDEIINQSKEAGQELDYNSALNKLLMDAEISPEVGDIISANHKKLYDEFINSGENIASPLSKRLRSESDVHAQILDALNVKYIQELRQIPEIAPLLKKATDKMVGKTVGEIQKDFNKVIDEIQLNPNFKKFYETYFDTPWESFIKNIKSVANTAFIADKRNWIPFFGEGKFGQRIINPDTGKIEKSIPSSVLKSLTIFLAADLSINVLKHYYGEGMTSGESVTLAFNDSYLSIIGAALGIVTKKVEEHRAEMGELTVDEVKSAFTPTVTALGRDINEYDFEKLSRGVWKVVDVDGDDNGVQTHYVVIKHSGETTVVPFSATEGINWGSDLTDWIKGIRQKYSQ